MCKRRQQITLCRVVSTSTGAFPTVKSRGPEQQLLTLHGDHRAAMTSAEHSVFAETQQFFTKQRWARQQIPCNCILEHGNVGVARVPLTSCASCRAAIEKLRADNEALKEEMQLENKFSVRPTSSAAAATIESLRQQSDACTQKVTAHAMTNARQYDGSGTVTPASVVITEAPAQLSSKADLTPAVLAQPFLTRGKHSLWLRHCTGPGQGQEQLAWGICRSPMKSSVQIGTERARVANLQRRAMQAQAQVEEQRRKMGGLRAAQDCDIQVCACPCVPTGGQMAHAPLTVVH